MLEFTQEFDSLIASGFGVDEYNDWYDVGGGYRFDNEGSLLLLFVLFVLFALLLLLEGRIRILVAHPNG